jgi:hypothetical protein
MAILIADVPAAFMAWFLTGPSARVPLLAARLADNCGD